MGSETEQQFQRIVFGPDNTVYDLSQTPLDQLPIEVQIELLNQRQLNPHPKGYKGDGHHRTYSKKNRTGRK